MLTRTLLALCAPLFLLASTKASAQEFSPIVEVEGTKLHLNGIGLRKATFLRFKVYWGALYLTERSSDAEAILASPTPKQARLRFLRDVGVEKLKDAFT